MSPAQDIVLIDPIHPYAVQFAELAGNRGLGTVCLWTSQKNRAGAWRFPLLGSDVVSAHHRVDLTEVGLRSAAELLGCKHDVVAVIPHVEPMVLPCVTLSQLLGLSWAQPELMPLFRNKYALKQALAGVPGGPRINRIALVADVPGVRAAMDALDLDQIVLKPNDGYGNVAVGFFDRRTPDATIAAHLDQHPGPMLLEERLEGAEYFVNGQVNAAGDVDITRIGIYVRATVNGRLNVELGEHSVRTHDPEFAPIAAYARQVMATSGVRRTPFHLECMVDENGPCLLEVGARLVGGDPALDSWLHDLDLVDAALSQYLGEGTSQPLVLNWDRYDSQIVGEVEGVSARTGRIVRVRGADRAEAMPGFLRWSWRPVVGDKVVVTVDLFGSCWRMIAVAEDSATWREQAKALRAAIELDVVGQGDRRLLLRARALAPAWSRLLRRGWALVAVR